MSSEQCVSDRPRALGEAVADAVRNARRNALASRSRRVILVLALIWMLSTFDLVFTLLAHQIGGFHELNPLARSLLDQSAHLAAFKFSTLATGTAILVLLRRKWFAELAAWLVCGVYVYLAFMWLTYYRPTGL